MEGLIREGEELIDCIDDPKVLDAGLIGAAQKVEHYEISGYGTARAFARLLGYENHAEILRSTLEEESKTDHKFTEIAESLINERALQTASH
jgi:ferritin-like metal-binding protein YciE